ncbi:MAG: GNAT family N-acetyltransferase [Pseudomonadota bacterium]
MEISIATTQQEREACYRLRHVVFVEEQGVPVELEIDEHDEATAIHFMGMIGTELVATARLCVFGEMAKIQRVAVARSQRGCGLGKQIIEHLVRFARDEKLGDIITLDAQTHAIEFYRTLGFETQGDVFDDAGIDHIRMVATASQLS